MPENTHPSRNLGSLDTRSEKPSLIGSDTPTNRAALTEIFNGWLAESHLTDLMQGNWPDGEEPFSLS
jgi:hypothetical protein